MAYPPLFILRHGQTEWNAQHRVQGNLDSPLTDLGRVQANMQRQLLQSFDLSNVKAICSPQGRAFFTAALALDGLVSYVATDARLREIGVGAWEGLRRDDIQPDLMADESEESALSLYERAPGGEGFIALRERCQSFLDELDGPAIVITHGITSRMLRLILLDLDTSEIGALPGGQGVVYRVENGVQSKLSIGA